MALKNNVQESQETMISAPESHKQGKVIAITNQKGGVGKTTTAINLATGMAAIYKKILLIDLDPQGNASTGVGCEKKHRTAGSYEALLLGGMKQEDRTAHQIETIMPTQIPYLDLMPSTTDLAGAEVELMSHETRERCLAQFLFDIKKKYDYIFIDCPPSLNLLTLNALVAADQVMVPLQCEFFALEGLSHLIETIHRVQQKFNPKLEIEGVLLTMFDGRNNLANMVMQDVKQVFGNKVYNTFIPRNVRVSEAPSFGQPVLVYDHRCLGAKAYMSVTSEFLKRQEIGSKRERINE